MTDYVMYNPDASNPYHGIPRLDMEYGNEIARLVLLPPGEIDVRMKIDRPVIDVNINQCATNFSINSDDVRTLSLAPETLGFFPRGSDVCVKVTNSLPGCLVELSETALYEWVGETTNGNVDLCKAIQYVPDSVAAHLGRAAIRFIRTAPNNAPQNRLTLEALAHGIAARTVAHITAQDGDADAEFGAWRSRSDWHRVRRAVDWAETYLIDPDLSVGDMAIAAGLSTCHFGVVFKTEMGESPYSYVLRRRAQFARDLIEGTDEPIAQVAYVSGFSSQAHLTTVMRRVLGVTPGKLRSRS